MSQCKGCQEEKVSECHTTCKRTGEIVSRYGMYYHDKCKAKDRRKR